MTKSVVFDFDGVLVVDSDGRFKEEAWQMILQPYRGQYEPLLAEAKTLYGSGKAGGRDQIFTHVYRRLGVPADKLGQSVRRAVRQFDDYVQARILQAGPAPGLTQLLVNLTKRQLALYINSSTPDEPLAVSTRNLKLDHFFKGVLGSSKNKVDNLREVACQEKIVPAEILFIGDSDSDVAAARDFGCRFVGVANVYNRWQLGQAPFPVIDRLLEVENYL